MSTGVQEQLTTTPANDALTPLRASLDQLVPAVEDGGLDQLDDYDLVGFLQAFEVERNRLALVDHRALRDAEQRGLAGRLGQSRLATVLTGALRISAGEAARRVRAMEAVGDRVSVLGEVTGCSAPAGCPTAVAPRPRSSSPSTSTTSSPAPATARPATAPSSPPPACWSWLTRPT